MEAAEGLASADRSVVLKEVVREVARRNGLRASFTPLLDPDGPGNGVHIHLNLLDADGAPLLYDAARPACLSELGGRFAAGILRHAGALSALYRAEPGLRRAPDAPPLERGRGLPGRAQPRNAAAHPAAGRARGRRPGAISCAWSTAARTRPPIPTWRSARSCARGSTGVRAGAARAADPRPRSRGASTSARRSATESARCRRRSRTRCRRSPRTISCAGG